MENKEKTLLADTAALIAGTAMLKLQIRVMMRMDDKYQDFLNNVFADALQEVEKKIKELNQ